MSTVRLSSRFLLGLALPALSLLYALWYRGDKHYTAVLLVLSAVLRSPRATE